MRTSAVCLILLLSLPAAGQERPLPDLDTFLKQARARLQPDDTRQSGYVYMETRRDRKLDASGQTISETMDVFESYPGLPGQQRWLRQIKEDGRDVPASELAKKDRERQQKMTAYLRRREQNPEAVRAEEARERMKERRKLDAAIEDALRIFDFRMIGREVVSGHGTVVLSYTPRPDSRPQTREGRVMKHFAGKAWVSETEYEVVRLEAEALDTVSYGLGLFARVHKGSRASFERRKVNGEEWLPARFAFTASARVMLVRMMRIGSTSEYSNYRKFTVSTEMSAMKPKTEER